MTDIHELEKRAMCGDKEAAIKVVSNRRELEYRVKFLKDQLYLIWQEAWKDHGMDTPAFDEKAVAHIAVDAMRSPVIERDKYRDQLVGMLCENGTTSGEGAEGVCTAKGESAYEDGECMEQYCPYWKEADAT